MSDADFSSLGLRSELLSSTQNLGYHKQTPVQALSLPLLLQNKDIIAQAQTGSGKTAAYGIGLLNKLQEKSFFTQALIICPTRELADQVAEEIRQLAKVIGNTKVLVLCGGKPLGSQLASLKRDPHIVVGTPGRLLQHLKKESLKMSQLQTLVLDEADRMLDMGFVEDIEEIMSHLPAQKQTLLFSATFPREIEGLGKKYQRNAEFVKVDSTLNVDEITHTFYDINLPLRSKFLLRVLSHHKPESALVFCNTIEKCQQLSEELRKVGIHALALHGDLEQFKRDQVLIQFSNRSSSVLIATDVAARGLDIKDLELVVNFELPRDPEVYVHRAGRTGRAGKQGLAISFFDRNESRRGAAIEELTNIPVVAADPSSLRNFSKAIIQPSMVSFLIQGGRKDKLRAGDLLGVLVKQFNVPADSIGKIDVLDRVSYIAINADHDFSLLGVQSFVIIKGKKFRFRKLR